MKCIWNEILICTIFLRLLFNFERVLCRIILGNVGFYSKVAVFRLSIRVLILLNLLTYSGVM